MKQKKLIVLLLFGLGLTQLDAQTTLFVHETGTVHTFLLNSIEKITFSPGNILVHRNIGDTITYPLSNVEFLNFNYLTTGILNSTMQNSTASVYPNPAVDYLQINFDSRVIGNMQIEIIDLQGRILIRQMINGSALAQIPISELAQGLYVCRLQNGDAIENIKFLKN